MTKRNSQTTSTKCQYHAADSKPKWCVEVKWFNIILIKDTNNEIVPTKTWKPWKPVAMKKVEPKIPSEIENEALTYSKAWNPVKIKARTIVKTKPKRQVKQKPQEVTPAMQKFMKQYLVTLAIRKISLPMLAQKVQS